MFRAAFENEMEGESDSESSLKRQQESLLEADQDEKTPPSQLYRYLRVSVDKYYDLAYSDVATAKACLRRWTMLRLTSTFVPAIRFDLFSRPSVLTT